MSTYKAVREMRKQISCFLIDKRNRSDEPELEFENAEGSRSVRLTGYVDQSGYVRYVRVTSTHNEPEDNIIHIYGEDTFHSLVNGLASIVYTSLYVVYTGIRVDFDINEKEVKKWIENSNLNKS